MSSKKFEAVIDRKTLAKGFLKAQKEMLPVTLWDIKDEKKIKFFGTISKIKDEEVIFNFDKKDFNSLTSHLENLKETNFYIPDLGFVFRAELITLYKNSDVKVLTPKKIFQVDRRQNLRIYSRDHYLSKASFSIDNHPFELECYDLSKEGVSFIVNDFNKKFFEVGDLIEDLYLDCVDLKLNAEILGIVPISPDGTNSLAYKGHKVCIKFPEIRERDMDKIDVFIFRKIDYKMSS